ncbi:MAG: hypothetical protein FWD33_01215 [Alphaproteobacteria bacterium]|nr:hypothetical protein [Alphaproteobacteria bacterium]
MLFQKDRNDSGIITPNYRETVVHVRTYTETVPESEVPTLWFAAAHCEAGVAKKVISCLDSDISRRFRIMDIGAQVEYGEEYNRANFNEKIGDLMALRVGEFDDNLGIVFSTSGWSDMFVSGWDNLRPREVHNVNLAAKARGRPIISNVIVIQVENRRDEDFLQNAARMVEAFVNVDLSDISAEDLVRYIKIQTNRHQNRHEIRDMWLNKPGVLMPYSELYKQIALSGKYKTNDPKLYEWVLKSKQYKDR